jgi:hypothetical protein
VFHKLLELAVRDEIQRDGAAGEDAERALDRLLEEEDARFAATSARNPPHLRDVFPPLIWRRKRRVVLDLAEKYLSGSVPRFITGAGTGLRSAKDLPENGSWSEVYLEARSLRLRGRADQIQRAAGDVVIRDLKTGRVLTNDGEVLPHIELQMRLYGAMAHEVWPSAQVSLIVDDGVEREVAFSRESELDVRSWLRSVLERLPSDVDIAAESIANPGHACDGCAYRHACGAYRNQAPEYWRTETPIRMPLDVWGETVAVTRRDDGLTDLTICDASGRMVKVFGLAALQADELQAGDSVWLFGLRTRDRRGREKSWRHPHNFFEVADDDPFSRAWTLEVFVHHNPGRSRIV